MTTAKVGIRMPGLVDILRIGLAGLACYLAILLKQLITESRDGSWPNIFFVSIFAVFCLGALAIVGRFSRGSDVKMESSDQDEST